MKSQVTSRVTGNTQWGSGPREQIRFPVTHKATGGLPSHSPSTKRSYRLDFSLTTQSLSTLMHMAYKMDERQTEAYAQRPWFMKSISGKRLSRNYGQVFILLDVAAEVGPRRDSRGKWRAPLSCNPIPGPFCCARRGNRPMPVHFSPSSLENKCNRDAQALRPGKRPQGEGRGPALGGSRGLRAGENLWGQRWRAGLNLPSQRWTCRGQRWRAGMSQPG